MEKKTLLNVVFLLFTAVLAYGETAPAANGYVCDEIIVKFSRDVAERIERKQAGSYLLLSKPSEVAVAHDILAAA